MKRIFSFLLMVCCLALWAAPAFAAPAPKDWTFMVFLNADNNLDSFGVGDLKEMTKVGSTNFSNIVVLIDRENGPATLYFVEKGNAKKLKDMGELDMGDYKLFAKFVKDTAAAYPAKHYAAIIWNHGSGWDKKKGPVFKGISYDDSTGNHITTAQLGLAAADIKKTLGRNLDVLGYDACLMSMMEVVYATRDSVDFIVSSEETEPGNGYPYDDILATLKKDTAPVDFVKTWVKAYVDSYNGGSQGSSDATQSGVDCSKLNALKGAIDGFAKAAMAKDFSAEFKSALSAVQSFYISDNKDLLHFVSLLKASVKDEAFQTAADALLAAGKAAVVIGGNCGDTMKNAEGLAIYFPESSYSFSGEYKNLAWAKDAMWDEMIADYYKKIGSSRVIADVEQGDVSSLMEYVKFSTDKDINDYIVSKLNFRVFAEGGIDGATQATVKSLINELKNK